MHIAEIVNSIVYLAQNVVTLYVCPIHLLLIEVRLLKCQSENINQAFTNILSFISLYQTQISL